MKYYAGAGSVLRSAERIRNDLFIDLVERSEDAYWCAQLTPALNVNLPVNDQLEHLLIHSTLLYCNAEFARSCHHADACTLFDRSLSSLVLYFSALPFSLFPLLLDSKYSLVDARLREVDSNGAVAWYCHTARGVIERDCLHRLWGRKRRIPASESDKQVDATLLHTLNEKQKTILHLSARGLTLKEIGETLALNPKTVATIRLRLMRKHGCRSVVEFVSRTSPMLTEAESDDALCVAR